MDLPIPTHLQRFFKPDGNRNSEYEVTGGICCDCGGAAFRLLQSNQRQLVELVCGACGKEILLFDSSKHGWDGFVCRNAQIDRTERVCQVLCKKCKKDVFKVKTVIYSQGRQDFADECVSDDESFSVDEWVNAFEWIKVSLTCCGCRRAEKDWLDSETM